MGRASFLSGGVSHVGALILTGGFLKKIVGWGGTLTYEVSVTQTRILSVKLCLPNTPIFKNI